MTHSFLDNSYLPMIKSIDLRRLRCQTTGLTHLEFVKGGYVLPIVGKIT